MTAVGAGQKWHLETKYRWVKQYNFYLQDSEWGPMFVRVCPYFPFSARICLNQHSWLAQKMQQAGIRFSQTGNAFRRCGDPAALQEIADSLTAKDLLRCGHKWLKRLIPFFRASERRAHGCWHQLFFTQVEYCDFVAGNKIAVMCPRQICGVRVGELSLMRRAPRSRAHLRYGSA
jgi:hypothetical protein